MSQPFALRMDGVAGQLWTAQGGRCALCGEPMPQRRSEVAHATLWRKWRPTLDHIKPRAKGGRDSADNLQLAHASCNKVKGAGSFRRAAPSDG